MNNFVSCLCEQNLSYLIISGTATDTQLDEAWITILSEYQELKNETIDSINHVRLTKEIKRLNNHLFLLDQCINFLMYRYSESIATSLRKLGYPFNPKSFLPSDYLPELTAIVQRSKTKYIQLQQCISELKREIEKLEQDIKVDIKREDFETKLIYIEAMQKVAYNMDTLTVEKFVLLERKYDQYIKAHNNERKD